jgi:site-specific recombinase XerD
MTNGRPVRDRLGTRECRRVSAHEGRLGKAAKMPFRVHPHMLRHVCGFKLANDGQDTRALQHCLKNIQQTVRYTELSPRTVQELLEGLGVRASQRQ